LYAAKLHDNQAEGQQSEDHGRAELFDMDCICVSMRRNVTVPKYHASFENLLYKAPSIPQIDANHSKRWLYDEENEQAYYYSEMICNIKPAVEWIFDREETLLSLRVHQPQR